MPFSSVLSGPGSREYSFGDACLAGWADDGGMLWPTAVPRLDLSTIARWAALSYPALCAEILKLFVPRGDADVSHADIDSIVLDAFSAFGSAVTVMIVFAAVMTLLRGTVSTIAV